MPHKRLNQRKAAVKFENIQMKAEVSTKSTDGSRQSKSLD
jgi:hypothetical protein